MWKTALKAIGYAVGGFVGINVAAMLIMYFMEWLIFKPFSVTIGFILIISAIVFFFMNKKNAS